LEHRVKRSLTLSPGLYFGPVITPLPDGTLLAERLFGNTGFSAMPDEEV
jgi:hypothetical protein